MPFIRTTINPDVETEVDDAEAVSLGAQGLLVSCRNTPTVDSEPAPAADLRSKPSTITSSTPES